MESLEERVARLERQIAHLERHLGIDPALIDSVDGDSRLPPDFYAAMRKGKKILAIKIYREATGASLMTAKKAVEEMERQGLGRG
ncbi:hypothetical protein FE391_20020 [Nonomuraea sp. KC401]|uniref:hypothetical protein n=1 Tax=unclassified Nonomuraea TaxID=2593643 RepID=UPI0010FF117F|nr:MULTISPECIES: hypothetical protein [unclassified Nonomuraea]NBE96168.1 hypothetical protein [Nonomuraea sp. K271]TLF71239.1 hypothetical protein FE391_20020 [Nonomuraea sp. KC401]